MDHFHDESGEIHRDDPAAMDGVPPRSSMKTIGFGPTPPTLPERLDLAGEDNLALRTPDGKEFVLAEAEIDDFAHEVALVRQNHEIMALLDARSKHEPTFSIDEARRVLELDQ